MRHLISAFILSGLFIAGCGNHQNIIPENKGRINIQLTDSPYPVYLINSTMVTIDKVELRQSRVNGKEEKQDSFIVISNKKMTVNLRELSNGIKERIGSADLLPGTYDMIRLHMVDAMVKLKDGTTFNLDVPNDVTSGINIEISPAIQLVEGQSSDVLIDFDASSSFTINGKQEYPIKGFTFSPVIQAASLSPTITN